MAPSFSSNFKIHEIPVAEAIWFEGYFHTNILHRIRKVSQWILGGALVIFLFTFLPLEGTVSESVSALLLAIAFFLFSYSSAIFLLERFSENLKRVRPETGETNFAAYLSFESALAVTHAFSFAKRKKCFELNSSALLFFLLKENPSLRFIFARGLLNIEDLRKSLKAELAGQPIRLTKGALAYSLDFQQTMQAAMDMSAQKGQKVIEAEDLLAALAVCNPAFKKYLVENSLFPEKDMREIAEWHLKIKKEIKERKKFWLKKNLRKYGTLGKEWASGYSITLDRFSSDYSKAVASSRFPKAIGHTREKEQIQRILSRQKINNVLLVGRPGAGKDRLIQDLASLSQLGQGKSEFINYRRVMKLDLAYLFSSTQDPEEVEVLLNRMFEEVTRAGNIILVIDNFHDFVGTESGANEPGRMNIAGVLTSYLHYAEFPLIALTTFAGLHRSIEQNPSLLSYFEKVEVAEISPDDTLAILEEVVPGLEYRYKRFISYPALKAIIDLSDKYIQDTPFPKKAIDLLDEAMGYLAQTKDKALLPEHIATVVTERTQIPVGRIQEDEKEILLHLEDLIHKRIVNQEQAVKEVASSLRRARSEVTNRKGPMGSFLFLGPTGVGKTETAKTLADIYFGSEARMIRLDMSEFQSTQDVERLLGSSAAPEGLLTTQIRENPFSLLLLDELEKAHPNIVNLFLQVLDDGHITDGLGRKVNFQHTIIIATSNAGYKLILQAIKQQTDFAQLKARMLEYLFQEGIYRPEFINRFDGVILFTPLTRQHLLDIAGLMLKKLQANMRSEKGIELEISEALKAKIAELGYDPTFGARNMRRVIQDKVENALAVALLSNTIKRGDRITIDPQMFEVKRI